jgi:acyl dehydratase
VRDQFVDTSTQLGLLSGVAVRAAGPDARPGRLALRMRRPVCPGDRLRMEARVGEPTLDDHGVSWVDVDVTASVDDAVHSTLTARVAVAGPAGRRDPWALPPELWHP